MPPRDQERCRTGVCREAVLDLLSSGRFPTERHFELLLDRLEREEDAATEPRRGDPR